MTLTVTPTEPYTKPDGLLYTGASNFPPSGGSCGGTFVENPLRSGSWKAFTALYQTDIIDYLVTSGVIFSLMILPQNDVSSVYISKFKDGGSFDGFLDGWNKRTQFIRNYFYESNGNESYASIYYDTTSTIIDEAYLFSTSSSKTYFSVDFVDRSEVTSVRDTLSEEPIAGSWSLFFNRSDPFLYPRAIFMVTHNLNDDCSYTGDLGTDDQFSMKGDYPYNSGLAFVGWS